MSCAPGKIASPSKEKTPKLRFRMREPEKRTPVVFEVRESRPRRVEVLHAAAGPFERLLPSVENYTAAGEGPCVGKAVAEDETDQPGVIGPVSTATRVKATGMATLIPRLLTSITVPS